MKLTTQETNAIVQNLEYGDKQRLALHLGVHPVHLSRYFKNKSMPRDKYIKTLKWINFINQL